MSTRACQEPDCNCSEFSGADGARFCGTCGHARERHEPDMSTTACQELGCRCSEFSGADGARFCGTCGHARAIHEEDTSATLPAPADATSEVNVGEDWTEGATRPIHKHPAILVSTPVAVVVVLVTIAFIASGAFRNSRTYDSVPPGYERYASDLAAFNARNREAGSTAYLGASCHIGTLLDVHGQTVIAIVGTQGQSIMTAIENGQLTVYDRNSTGFMDRGVPCSIAPDGTVSIP